MKAVFIPHFLRHLASVKRVDVVWDRYITDSMNSDIRKTHGTGVPLWVGANTCLPLNWKSFLRLDFNKEELFKFLPCAIRSTAIPAGKILITTYGEDVLCTPSTKYVTDLQPCSHEEADYRMLLHAAHAHKEGHRDIAIHATDTDVLVLCVATASGLQGVKLWLVFGKDKKYIAAHTIATGLGTEASTALLFLHAISGCDTVSSFSGIGKKTAFSVWRSMPHLSPVFVHLSKAPNEVTDEDIKEIERFKNIYM